MSEDRPPGPPTPADLLDTWRRAASEMEQRWNDFLNQAMGTDTFAQAMARSMDGYLALQANFTGAMEQYLRAFNLPTRGDIVQLAERISLLEQRIADLSAALTPPSSSRVPSSAAEPHAAPTAQARKRPRKSSSTETG